MTKNRILTRIYIIASEIQKEGLDLNNEENPSIANSICFLIKL
ncbi:MAG TPA: hypothetical protein VH500_07435 [Nitrososphaeraceae archaeon]